MKLLLFLMTGCAFAGVPSNAVTITNGTGATVNQPYTISRFFAKGEILNYPQPIGIAQWQADVKTRWRDGRASFTVTAATNTNPIRITTSAPHGFMDGDEVRLSGLGGGNTAANGTFIIAKVSATGFDLVNSAGNGVYSSGGTAKGPALGSVQHALISFWKSTLNGTSDAIAFTNSASPCYLGNQTACNAASLDKAGMAAFNGGSWGAAMLATQAGTTYTTDAKALIAADNFTYWLRGPIATVAVVEDRTPARSADFGWKCNSTYRMLADTTTDTISTYDYATGVTPTAHGWVDGQRVNMGALPGGVLPSTALGSWGAFSNTRYVRNATSTGFQVSVTATGAISDLTVAGSGSQYVTSCGKDDYSTATWANDTTYHSLHPQFILTFFPGWSGVYVEYVMQNGWSTALADQRYTITLKKGAGNATTVVTKDTPHYARTEWVYRAWSGTATTLTFPTSGQIFTSTLAPPNFSIDMNKQYIIYSKMVGQLDPSLTVSTANASVLQNITYYQDFLGNGAPFVCNPNLAGSLPGHGSHTLCGNWDVTFSDPGGRGELALISEWYARHLYSQDSRFYYLALGNADIMGTAPYHIWESDTSATRYYDLAHTVTSFSHPISVNARPTFRNAANGSSSGLVNDTSIAAGDRLGYIDPFPATYASTSYSLSSSYVWQPEYNQADPAHQGAFHEYPYFLTGDYFYLEDGLAYTSNFPTAAIIGQRHNDWGISVFGQNRGTNWTLRSMYMMARMAPDGFAEKGYFLEKANITTAAMEAFYSITDGHYAATCNPATENLSTETRPYCWYKWAEGIGADDNPWHITAIKNQWNAGSPTPYQNINPPTSVESIFQMALAGIVMGWAADAGFPTDRLAKRTPTLLIEIMNGGNPREVENYNVPTAPYRPVSALASNITSTQLTVPLAAAPTWMMTPPYPVVIYTRTASGVEATREAMWICSETPGTPFVLNVCASGRGALLQSQTVGGITGYTVSLAGGIAHAGDGGFASNGSTTSSSVGPDGYSPHIRSLAEYRNHLEPGDINPVYPWASVNFQYFSHLFLNLNVLAYGTNSWSSGHSGFDAFTSLRALRDDPTKNSGYSYNNVQNPQLMYIPRREPVLNASVQAGDTFALVKYKAPSAGLSDSACTVDGVSDGQSSTTNRTYIKTGLTAGTLYVATIHCNADYYDSGAGVGNTTVPYRTLATLSGTATLSIQVGAGGTATLNHGSTTGLGTSVSAACTAGCTLTATVPKGLRYYQITRDTGAVGPVRPAVVR